MKKYYVLIGMMTVVYGGALTAAQAGPGASQQASVSTDKSELAVVSGFGPYSNSQVRAIKVQGVTSQKNELLKDVFSTEIVQTLAALETTFGQQLLVIGAPKAKRLESYVYKGDGKFEKKSQLRVTRAPYMIAALKQGDRDYLLTARAWGAGGLSLLQWLGDKFEVKKETVNGPGGWFHYLHTLQDGDENYVLASDYKKIYSGIFNEKRLTIDWGEPIDVKGAQGEPLRKILAITSGQVGEKPYLFVSDDGINQIIGYPFTQGIVGSPVYQTIISKYGGRPLATFTRNNELFLVVGGVAYDNKLKVFKVTSEGLEDVAPEGIESGLVDVTHIVTFPYHLQTQKGVQSALLEQTPLPEDIAGLVAQMTTGIKSSYYDDEKEAILAAPQLDLDAAESLLHKVYTPPDVIAKKLLGEFVLSYMERHPQQENVLKEWREKAQQRLSDEEIYELVKDIPHTTAGEVKARLDEFLSKHQP